MTIIFLINDQSFSLAKRLAGRHRNPATAKNNKNRKMILIIRISGQVDVPGKIEEALYKLKLRRKYASVLINPSPEKLKLLKKIRDYIAYGNINKETLKKLIEKRAEFKGAKKNIDAEKIILELEKNSLEKLGLKPFFRLHPPRGGIDSKKHFGTSKKAVLGDNREKINDLVRRML